MKKKLSLLIFFLFFLSSCSMEANTNHSDEYLDLREQYENFRNNDIESFMDFQSFINEVSLKTSLSSVAIKVQLFDEENNLVATKKGAGVIFYGTNDNIYIITANTLVFDEDEHFIMIEVTDGQGKKSEAELEMECSDTGLAVLEVEKSKHPGVRVIDVATHIPLYGEPILLMGYQNKIINSKSMGLYQGEFSELELKNKVMTSILTDVYSNGGAIINIRLELIGIQIDVIDYEAVTVTFLDLQIFIELFNKKQTT